MAEAKASTKSTTKKAATAAAKPAAKAAPKKAAPVKKAAAPKAAAARKPVAKPAAKLAARVGNGGGNVRVTPEQRYRMIAEAAYYQAEKRGFVGGDCAQDWLDAEAEIDSLLSKM